MATPTATATATPTATPTPPPFPEQAASVEEGTEPDQAVADGAFRYTLEAAVRGVTVPSLSLPVTGYGEWVVLVVHARNVSEEPAVMSMPRLELSVAGPVAERIPLDSGTGVIARYLGFFPAYDNTDSVLFAPGEGHRLALVYLVRPGSVGLALVTGTSAIDLETALSVPDDVTALGEAPPKPDLLEATVTDVIDGQTIAIEADGAAAEVRYLGITAPQGNECWAEEATALNVDLVEGQTIWLERQQTDVDKQGRLLRDVWVAGPDGGLILVGQRLVANGAAEATPEEGDNRFGEWLLTTQAGAQAEEQGLWGACDATRQRISPLAAVPIVPASTDPGGTAAWQSGEALPRWRWAMLPWGA